MNNQDLKQNLNLLRVNLRGIEPLNIASSGYLGNVRTILEAIYTELETKPANLLTHLCSLTVAERETILRVAEMAAQTWCYDETQSEYSRALQAVSMICGVEKLLREVSAPTVPAAEG